MSQQRQAVLSAALAVLAAAVLLGLGYWLGQESADGRLAEAKAEADRFNRQAARQSAVNTQLLGRAEELERRLAQAEAALARASQNPEDLGVKSRLLRHGEAAILLGGALVATLRGVIQDPPQARIALQNADGQMGQALLEPGGEALIRVNGQVWRLILKKVSGGSATIALLPRR